MMQFQVCLRHTGISQSIIGLQGQGWGGGDKRLTLE